MKAAGRIRLAAGVLAVVALVVMVADRDEGLRGTRAPEAPPVPAPTVLLAERTDEGSPPGQPALFEDLTEASGVAGAVGSARLTTLTGPGAEAEAARLGEATTFERILATETYFASGQAWGDHDGDGDLDLYLTDPAGPNRLLDNDGRGAFTVAPHAEDVAATDQVSGSAVWVDYDDDGRPDLHVLGDGGDRLFHNDGPEGFSDATVASGLDDPGKGQAAAWADADGDGNLDLYVADSGCQPCGPARPVPRAARDQDRLFLSAGDGTFVDATASIRRFDRTRGLGMAAAWLDHDADGDQDLYVVNDVRGDRTGGATPGNLLLRNDGLGCGGICFTDVSEASGAGVRADGHGLAVADLEGDGDPDLLVTNGGWQTGPNLLLENVGGRFREVGADRVANVGEWAWGTAFLDADVDGDLDAALGTGLSELALQAPAEDLGAEDLVDPTAVRAAVTPGPPPWPVAPDPAPRTDNTRMLLQGDDGTFTTALLGPLASVAPVHQGVAVGDADGDGRPDLALGTIGAGYVLLGNRAGAAHRSVFDLRGDGRRLPTDPVGAQVRVTDDSGQTQTRTVQIDGTGSDRRLLFGFGAARPVRAEVRWADGEVEVLDVDVTDRLVTVTADPFRLFAAEVQSEPLP